MAEAHRIGRAVLSHRAFPERERIELAARVGDQAVAFRMKRVVAEEVGGRHEFARGLRAMRAHLDLQAPRLVACRVEKPQVGSALVDDPLAVGGGVARVVIGVVGMPPQLAAIRRA